MSTPLARHARLIVARRFPPLRCDECGVPLEKVFSPVRHLQRHVDAKQAASIQQRAAAP